MAEKVVVQVHHLHPLVWRLCLYHNYYQTFDLAHFMYLGGIFIYLI